MRAGVPVVVGGLIFTHGVYCSVDPGTSACWQCLGTHRLNLQRQTGGAEPARIMRGARVNRGIGPVTTMLGSLVALEVMRYLTGIVAPVAAGCYRIIDFAGDCTISTDPWPRDPDCAVCAGAVRAPKAAA